MNRNELKTILLENFSSNSVANFADVEKATVNALVEYFGLEDLSPREIKKQKGLIMALIEEVIDEVLPAKLEDRVKDFAEVKQFARDAEVVFTVKNKGRRRAQLSIVRGQRGGLYQAARLDAVNLTLPTYVETVGVFVTLEEILLGKYTLVELMDNILDGFVERLYVNVIEALQNATVPEANKGAAAGFDPEAIDPVIRVVAAYGRPIIMGFHNTVAKITNAQGWTGTYPNVPAGDLADIRDYGMVGVYKGTPVIKLPNYIANEVTNDEWLLDESKMFILPAGEKPVKVALKGDLHIQEVEHPAGSEEWAAHKLLGVGLLLANNVGIYTDTGEVNGDTGITG